MTFRPRITKSGMSDKTDSQRRVNYGITAAAAAAEGLLTMTFSIYDAL